ncbi:MAG: ABC transporter, substrate-binding protein (cluster 1, maltose/g3p/polyamine/iron), partial [uncultured Thermomicrobiales bacterium]
DARCGDGAQARRPGRRCPGRSDRPADDPAAGVGPRPRRAGDRRAARGRPPRLPGRRRPGRLDDRRQQPERPRAAQADGAARCRLPGRERGPGRADHRQPRGLQDGDPHLPGLGRAARRPHLVRRQPRPLLHRARADPADHRRLRAEPAHHQVPRGHPRRLPGHRRPVLLPAPDLLPVGHLLQAERLPGERHRDAAPDVGRVPRRLRHPARGRHQADHDRHQVGLARGWLVRLPQHAHQRPRVPRSPDRRPGRLQLARGQGDLPPLGGAARSRGVRRQPDRPRLAGRRAAAARRRGRDVPHRRLHHRRGARGPAGRPRLLPLPGHQPRRADRRGRPHRRPLRQRPGQEPRPGQGLPGLRRLRRGPAAARPGGGADRDQRRRPARHLRRADPEGRPDAAGVRLHRPVLRPRHLAGDGRRRDAGVRPVHGQPRRRRPDPRRPRGRAGADLRPAPDQL